MTAVDARFFKRRHRIEKLRKNSLLVVGLAVSENDDVDVCALRVFQRYRKGKLVG